MHRADPGEVAVAGPARNLDRVPEPVPAREQVPLRFVLMRGGTSKAVFLREGDLPPDRAARERLILAVFGSPDSRQIDGLGGADLLTSKCAIIGPPSRDDADLDYTFAQVSVAEPTVDWDMNCGNISAAVGVYALQEGLVRLAEPATRVRIHNTNTNRVLVAEVPVADGEPQVEGALAIDGVPGTGAAIMLDYCETAGGRTGALLPTGRPTDDLFVGGLGRVRVSVLDLANLCVFFPATDAGLTGTEGPGTITAAQLAAAAAIKRATAALLGISHDGQTPIPVAIAPPADYTSLPGEPVRAADVSLLARVIGGKPPVLHKAYPGTTGACTAVAAAIRGTVVADAIKPAAAAPAGGHATDERRAPAGQVVIGHPSGVIPVWAEAAESAGSWVVRRATYARTARRLAEGYTFVRRSALTRGAGLAARGL